MRAKALFVMGVAGLIAVVLMPTVTTGQPGGKKGGGGFQFGGGGMTFDAGGSFDRMANGRTSIPISEIRGFGKDFAVQFAAERGITNGQFTRSQYIEFSSQLGDQMKARFGGGDKGGKKGFGGGDPGADPGGFGGKKKRLRRGRARRLQRRRHASRSAQHRHDQPARRR